MKTVCAVPPLTPLLLLVIVSLLGRLVVVVVAVVIVTVGVVVVVPAMHVVVTEASDFKELLVVYVEAEVLPEPDDNPKRES